MKQHYVEFFSPGTFVSESNRITIDRWDVDAACEMAHTIKQRYGATPYGFSFLTRERAPDDLDAKEVARSPMYYLGGKIETIEEVEARNDPKEGILRSNMRLNGYDRIIINTNSWRFTGGLNVNDIVLDWKPRK